MRLAPYAANWRDIGRGLGFSQGEMNSIQASPMLMMEAPRSYLGVMNSIQASPVLMMEAPGMQDPQSCLRQMLSQWLQWAPGDGRGSTGFATKESLRAALFSINLGRLAKQFR